MEKTIQKTVDKKVYECDGPECVEFCDSPYTPLESGTQGCAWKTALDSDEPRGPESYEFWKARASRYFCTWTCLARWAFGKAEGNG